MMWSFVVAVVVERTQGAQEDTVLRCCIFGVCYLIRSTNALISKAAKFSIDSRCHSCPAKFLHGMFHAYTLVFVSDLVL